MDDSCPPDACRPTEGPYSCDCDCGGFPIITCRLYEDTPDGPLTILDGVLVGGTLYGFAPPDEL